ncbi:E3 ubiquitin-protein ligase LRSAM1-like isoform X1 [Trichogramma pretiosum]|uniref:E3 ubiquitin-protein ligase LRSAM1-like isoform X1 n=1 Tax=Trichogramma pretiosum TaxID=7493 RepID=UPI0006C9CD42|nr:E3 ubiquitin-protein ligase LRSAM1-like isoform X1 [Trichogramma pretiosum]
MSFVRKHVGKSSGKIDYKARLEHKLHLAKMSPLPIYDISECNLENVPSSTYVLCQVFRKEVLLMHSNKLKSLSGGGALKNLSLITTLDLHSNELTTLPFDIVHLVSLKELYLQDNSLTKLPNDIALLKNLSILNLSNNKLKYLPETIGELSSLTFLDLSHNKGLHELPKSLGRAQLITDLNIDGLKLSYPSESVLSGGTIVIIAFLANECGIDYAPEDFLNKTEVPDIINQHILHNEEDNDLQATLKKLEKLKEQRQNALIEVEENIKYQKQQELELQSKLKVNKQKLLVDLANQQFHLDKELEKVQHERDSNRLKLLSFINDAELEADNVIKEFLHTTEEQRQIQAQLFEIEKREEMEFLSRSHSKQSLHRTKDTLIAMKDLLEEELIKEKKLAAYTAFRDSTAQSLLSLEVESNDQLLLIMQDQERNRQDLVIRLKEDEKLQKAVVAALLERSDARSWSIMQQVHLVQSQLAALTSIELERKKLEVNQHINDIADRRVTLSEILLSLLDQQEERRQQLLDTIKHIEEQRNNSSRTDSSFWLLQYQTLIETRPQGLLETLDSSLVRHVAMAGVLHCLPLLWTLPSVLLDLNEDHLKSMGIKSEFDRSAIIKAVENYLNEKKLNSRDSCIPSAPLEMEPSTSSTNQENVIEATAPTECIVCMDYECEVIYLPCGHFCCCAKCTEMISSECPMCRAKIVRRLRITRQ